MNYDDISYGEYPDQPITVTKDNFESVTSNYQNVIIDFWAPWCGPCKALSPTIDSLAREMHGDVVFGKLNTDENQQMAMNLGVRSLPTLLVIQNGEVKQRIVGSHNHSELSSKIKNMF